MRYLILGSGPAGIAAARAARGADPEAEIVVATEEAVAPYLRPILPDFLAGTVDRAAMGDPQAADLSAQRIVLRNGKAACRVDPGDRRVRFEDGTEERFDGLLIATGGKPALPPPLDRHPGAVLPFDSLADAERIRGRALRPGPVVVYGPGYVAIEACRALSRLGRQVVWIRPDLPRFGYALSGEFEATVLDRVRGRGVRIREGDDIASIREVDERVFELGLLQGDRIRCSMVVAATERLPAVGFLKGSGVRIGTGIVVDERLRTSVPGIYAAGDCAELYDEASREVRINFGWRSAVRQGALAGGNLAGAEQVYLRRTEEYLWALFGPSLLDRGE